MEKSSFINTILSTTTEFSTTNIANFLHILMESQLICGLQTEFRIDFQIFCPLQMVKNIQKKLFSSFRKQASILPS